jgi:hypothetical protein
MRPPGPRRLLALVHRYRCSCRRAAVAGPCPGDPGAGASRTCGIVGAHRVPPRRWWPRECGVGGGSARLPAALVVRAAAGRAGRRVAAGAAAWSRKRCRRSTSATYAQAPQSTVAPATMSGVGNGVVSRCRGGCRGRSSRRPRRSRLVPSVPASSPAHSAHDRWRRSGPPGRRPAAPRTAPESGVP